MLLSRVCSAPRTDVNCITPPNPGAQFWTENDGQCAVAATIKTKKAVSRHTRNGLVRNCLCGLGGISQACHCYGKAAAAPVTAPASNSAPRKLSGTGLHMYGAQLPGR